LVGLAPPHCSGCHDTRSAELKRLDAFGSVVWKDVYAQKGEEAMLDQIGNVVLIAVIMVNFGSVAASLPSLGQRIVLLAAGGAWIGLAVTIAASGVLLAAHGVGPVPPIGIMVLEPLLVAAVIGGLSARVRELLLGLPTRLLVGLNSMRLLGVFFLLLAEQGRLAGPFPYFAGWGDIVTGALALPVMALMARRGALGAMAARGWNWFGALDLITAVALGVMSGNGSALQVFETGVAGPLPVQMLPWSLIPTVLVPFYLILHGIIHAQLRGRVAIRRPVAVGAGG
jgi:hypothetical protein